jgi:hypothetical protein
LFFSGAHRNVLDQLFIAGPRAAEKQKEKGCVAVACYKQATTNVVKTAQGGFALAVVTDLIVARWIRLGDYRLADLYLQSMNPATDWR